MPEQSPEQSDIKFGLTLDRPTIHAAANGIGVTATILTSVALANTIRLTYDALESSHFSEQVPLAGSAIATLLGSVAITKAASVFRRSS